MTVGVNKSTDDQNHNTESNTLSIKCHLNSHITS